MASENQPDSSNPSLPVGSFRKASICSSQWDKMSGTDQFRICGLCNLTVYDFANMDAAQARALVYKRESKENPSFYRRFDGRFLTSDCPVALRKTWTKFSGISAVMVLLIAVIALPNLILLAPEDTSPEFSKVSSPAGQKLQTQFPLLRSRKPGSGRTLSKLSAFQPAASVVCASPDIPLWLEARPRSLGQNFGSTYEGLQLNQLTSAPPPVLPDWLQARHVNQNASSINTVIQDSGMADSAYSYSNSTTQPANGSSGIGSGGTKINPPTTDSSIIEKPDQVPRTNYDSETKNNPYVKNY